MTGKIWIWVRLPIDALRAAIDALKERSSAKHLANQREGADADDQSAEDLKTGLRRWGQGKDPP